MSGPMFAKLRRKIADFILGNQTVLFTARRNIDLIETDRYTDLPDPVLGAVTRRWFWAIEQAHQNAADREARPVSTMVAQHGVLALAAYAQKANAEEASFVLRGSLDGGRTEGVFRVRYDRLPDDYEFSEPGVAYERDADDPSKITSLRLSFDLSEEYARWKTEQAGQDA